jgi:hypothetical protein
LKTALTPETVDRRYISSDIGTDLPTRMVCISVSLVSRTSPEFEAAV